MKIDIIKCYEPDKKQKNDMDILYQACKVHDGINNPLMVVTDFSQPEDYNCFLLYTENQLAGAAVLFSSYEIEGEVTAMVHPQFRRKGFFNIILRAIKEEMQKRSIKNLVLVCEKDSPSGLALIKHGDYHYHHSELRMKFDFAKQEKLVDDFNNFQLEEVAFLPYEDLIEICARCFNLDLTEARSNIDKKVKSNKYHIFRGIYINQVVGMGGFYTDDDEAWIVGIAVDHLHQKKGLGKKILKSITNLLLEKGYKNILLEVYCDNEGALQLYSQSGFDQVSCDLYYSQSPV